MLGQTKRQREPPPVKRAHRRSVVESQRPRLALHRAARASNQVELHVEVDEDQLAAMLLDRFRERRKLIATVEDVEREVEHIDRDGEQAFFSTPSEERRP